MATDCTSNNGAIFQVAVHGKGSAGQTILNSYQVLLVNGGPLTLNEVANSLSHRFEDLYDLVKLFCSVVTTWTHITASHLNGNCATGAAPFTGTITGSLAGDAVPSGVAALASFPTGVKRVNMRKYWGQLAESSMGPNGNLDATTKGLIEDAADNMIAEWTDGGITWQIGYFSPKTLSFEIPTGKVVSTIPAYQTRRRQGSGS